MRCPRCNVDDDKVVDSRAADDGSAIRRRRQCLACGWRFTTYERCEEATVVVVKRSGTREPFDRSKIAGGVRQAAKYRPVTDEQVELLAAEVDEWLRLAGVTEVTTQEVGVAVLDRLRALDPVVYLRFASVYKGFEDPADFEREATSLSGLNPLTKLSEPKSPPADAEAPPTADPEGQDAEGPDAVEPAADPGPRAAEPGRHAAGPEPPPAAEVDSAAGRRR